MGDAYFGIAMLILVVIPCALIYFGIMKANSIQLKEHKFWSKNVLVVTAYPGDEASLFLPSIVKLSHYNSVSLLCLSEGRSQTEEFKNACDTLDIAGDRVELVGGDKFERELEWKLQDVKSQLTKYLKDNNNKFDLIVTYDDLSPE
jgi:LmbE family N-acetylglucosaminyl deacetylase